jgi:hypothetical protein
VKLRIRQVQLRAPHGVHLDRSTLERALHQALDRLDAAGLPDHIEQLRVDLDAEAGPGEVAVPRLGDALFRAMSDVVGNGGARS